MQETMDFERAVLERWYHPVFVIVLLNL